jgi:hypothetical protein
LLTAAALALSPTPPPFTAPEAGLKLYPRRRRPPGCVRTGRSRPLLSTGPSGPLGRTGGIRS